MATSQIAGMSDAQWDALVKGAQQFNTGQTTTASPSGALAGASTGLPKGSVPAPVTPTLPGGSGGGGWMGVIGAQNMANSALPGAAAGAQAGIPSTGIPAPTTNTPTPTAQPISANQANTYTPPDYAALAAARTAAALAQKKTIAEQQKASLDRSFARSNEITQDNRTLENGQINRTLSPFSGKSAFDKGIIGRERTLADESSTNNLNAQKANIDQLLADYENATADEQVRIADELQRADRAYQLDLANATGTMANGTRTLAGQQFDYNTSPTNPNNQGQVLQNQGQAQLNILNQYKIDSYPAESKAAAQQIQQQLKSGQLSNDAAEYNLKQLKDPNSTINQANAIDLQLKQLDLKNAPEKARLEIQQLQKQIAEIGKVHKAPQSEADIAADKVKLSVANKQLADIANGIYPGDKPVPAPKPTVVDSKTSTDNHTVLSTDIKDAKNAAEANALIEANKNNLTDADYKDLKKQVIDNF